MVEKTKSYWQGLKNNPQLNDSIPDYNFNLLSNIRRFMEIGQKGFIIF